MPKNKLIQLSTVLIVNPKTKFPKKVNKRQPINKISIVSFFFNLINKINDSKIFTTKNKIKLNIFHPPKLLLLTIITYTQHVCSRPLVRSYQ